MSGEIDGFVLTGGASRRMGRDKASIRFGDSSLAGRANSVLSAIAENVHAVGITIVPGIPNLPDIKKSGQPRGSIFGLHSALFHSQNEWTAVLACDLPFITGTFFQRLVALCGSVGQQCDAIVPVQPDGRYQPLAALYRSRSCLHTVERMIADENCRLSNFVESINAYRVLPDEYGDLNERGTLFFNINTLEDYALALDLAAASEAETAGNRSRFYHSDKST
jgi:molybdenum cofactor guanylyltransferase